MTDNDDRMHRSQHYRADGDTVEVREVDDEDGVFELRMPIASTGEVRNEGDDPLTRDELNGMARQLQEREIGVFPAHGRDNKIAAGRYSPFERLGDWSSSGIESRDDSNVLMATARMPDPETLPAATGQYREALAILKEQAQRGISQDASITWREDESFPGGVDLMEASIVGIGADWRTNTGDEAAELITQAAVGAGADPDALVERVAAAVDGDGEMPRDITEEQIELARDVIRQFEGAQGDATLQDFESWLYESEDELGADESVAARAVVQEYIRSTTPWQDPISETIRPWLSERDGSETSHTTDDMSDSDDPGDEQAGTDGEQDASDGETDERVSDDEYRESMLEMQREQTDLLQSLAADMDEDEDDDEDGGEQEGDDADEDDDEDEQQADADGETTEQDADDDGEERDSVLEDAEATLDEYDELREQVASGEVSLRDAVENPTDHVDTDEDGDEERDADEEQPDDFDDLHEFA